MSKIEKLSREEDIFNQVKEILIAEMGIDPEHIGRDSNLVNDLGMDSLDSIEVLCELEERFGLEIPDEVAEKLITVGQIVEYIK
jgi:acyl carrier protein